MLTVGIGLPAAAEASPARRLARQGVVVPAPGVIVAPAAPVVIAPRPWRRLGPPAAIVILPAVPAAAPAAGTVVPREVLALSPGKIAPGMVVASSPAPRLTAAAPVPRTPDPQPVPTVAPPGRIEEIPAPPAAPGGEAATEAAEAAFTPAWYARHPDAWRPSGPAADWWRAADVATVTGWLGRPIAQAAASGEAGKVATAGGDQPGADGLRSVLVLQSGHGPEAAGSDWLPLGVFAVVPSGGASAHNFQQLAVDRSGKIRGNFYDALSDTILPITGAVDPATLRAAWTVGANGSRFETAVGAFTTSPRTVMVTAGGGSRPLEIVPIKGP